MYESQTRTLLTNRLVVVDLVRFYPEGAAPGFSLAIQDFYIDTFNDKFFTTEAPAWFRAYLILEAVYHLPISVWMLSAILEGKFWEIRCGLALTWHQTTHGCLCSY